MKLYWRYKKDGKWTWKPAPALERRINADAFLYDLEEE